MRLTSRLAKVERAARVWVARTAADDETIIVISWGDGWRDDWHGGEPVPLLGDALDALLPAPVAEAEPSPAPEPGAGFRESTLRERMKPYRRTRSR